MCGDKLFRRCVCRRRKAPREGNPFALQSPTGFRNGGHDYSGGHFVNTGERKELDLMLSKSTTLQ